MSHEHVHNFSGRASYDAGHSHQFNGITKPAITGQPHFHSAYTTTEVVQNHSHVISNNTGPVIPSQNTHVHQLSGATSRGEGSSGSHSHTYNVTTGAAEPIGGPGGSWTQGPGPAY